MHAADLLARDSNLTRRHLRPLGCPALFSFSDPKYSTYAVLNDGSEIAERFSSTQRTQN